MATRRDIDIFGADPYGLSGTASQTGGYVPEPRLPQVRPGPPTGGTGVRTIVDAPPAATPPTTGSTAPANVFNQGALQSYLAGYPHTPAGLQAAYAANPAIFGGATITGSKGDKLQLPNGQVVDLIQSAGTGGTGWQWLQDTGAGTGMSQYFTDPTQQFWMGGMDAYLKQLQDAKQNQPSLDDITKLVNDAVAQWSGPQAQPESMTAAIQALSRMLGEPMPENAQLDTVTENLRKRVGELRAAPYSAGDEAALRAKAFDSLEKDRTAAKARILEELGAKGHAPTSGVVARALQEVDQAFDGYRAQNTNAMAMSEMALRETRGTAADTLEMNLAQLGGIDQQAEMQWKAAQLQAGVNAANLDLLWQQEANRRLQAALGAQTGLQALKTGQWDAMNLLNTQGYQVSKDPYNMGISSMGAANNVLSGQPDLTSILGALSGLSGLQSNQNQFNSAQMSNYLSGLMSLIGALYK